MKSSSSISGFQTFILCVVSAAGGTVCLAPFLSGGADGSWCYAVIIASSVSAVTAMIYMRTVKRCGFSSFDELLRGFLPDFAARLLLLLAGLFFAAEAALSAYAAADAAEMYLLDKTPSGVILLALLTTACILFDSGVRYLARCSELILLLLALPAALLLLICLFNVDLGEAAVAFQPDAGGIAAALPSAAASCAGGAAVFVFACSTEKSSRVWAAPLGFLCAAGVSVLLYCCAAGIFTTDGTAIFTFPFIEGTRSVSIGNIALTERFDAFFIAVMMMLSILQLAIYGFCAAHCLSGAAGLKSHRSVSFLILPLVFILAYCADIGRANMIAAVCTRGLPTTAVIVLILCAAAVVFRKGADTHAA